MNCINGLVNKYCDFLQAANIPISQAADTIIGATIPANKTIQKADKVKNWTAAILGVALVAAIVLGAVVGGPAWIALGLVVIAGFGFSVLHQKAMAKLNSPQAL